MSGGPPGGGGSQAGSWRTGKGLNRRRKWERNSRQREEQEQRLRAGQLGMGGTEKRAGQAWVRGELWGSLRPFPPSDPNKAPASTSRAPARLHHQLLATTERLLAPATYRALTCQDLYPRASSPLGIPRARPAPYPLPNIQADRAQGGLHLQAGLGLLSPTAVCLGSRQDPQ